MSNTIALGIAIGFGVFVFFILIANLYNSVLKKLYLSMTAKKQIDKTIEIMLHYQSNEDRIKQYAVNNIYDPMIILIAEQKLKRMIINGNKKKVENNTSRDRGRFEGIKPGEFRGEPDRGRIPEESEPEQTREREPERGSQKESVDFYTKRFRDL